MKSILVLSLLLDVAGSGSMVMAQSPGTFTATGDMTTERMNHTATLLPNGKVLIAGGSAIGVPSSSQAKATAELYDAATGTFTSTGSMTTARVNHSATLLPNGKVLIVGGGEFVGSAELYDPSTGAFTATGEMTTAPDVVLTATLLNNGKVLITGVSYTGTGNYVARAELYDPVTGSFAATGEMTTLGFHLAAMLFNGKVLFEGSYVAGGNDTPGGNELYDPDTGTFSPTGGKAYPNLFPRTASLLTTGQVLVTSSPSCYPGNDAELYDPTTETSSATGSMRGSRYGGTTTLLPDGKVLIAGRDWLHPIGGANLYDPVTGTFSYTEDIPYEAQKGGHTATLLPNGTVLLTGGHICCVPIPGTVATAEIYHPAVLASPVWLWAILHSGTRQVVSPGNPTVAGEALEIYLTGLTDGGAIPPQVAIGGRMAEVLFYGNAPGLPGLNQVNVRVPSGVEPGPAVPVRLTYVGRSSNEVTIGVR